MRARDIEGKTVAKVVQERTSTEYGRPVYSVDSIVFTDGTVLYFTVAELESEYAIEGSVLKKGNTDA